MKKIYTTPILNVIQLSAGESILASSADRFDVGISDDAMDGSEALSAGKQSPWDTGDMWK